MINYADYSGGPTFFSAPGVGRVSPKLVGQNGNGVGMCIDHNKQHLYFTF